MITYILLIFFALAPSTIWLLFYLRKDVHPESNRMILKIFFLGALAVVAAYFIEIGLSALIDRLSISNPALNALIYWFLGIALVEELCKYWVVKSQIFKSEELDEPLDLMLYMMISALGFAALENIVVFLSLKSEFLLWETFAVGVFRFLGATFLHALASGLFGYYLVLHFYEPKKKLRYFLAGLTLAILFHGLFNLSIANPELIYKPLDSIINIKGIVRFLIPVILLASLAIFVSLAFKKTKELKGVCKQR